MTVRIEPNAEPIPGYRLIHRLGGGGFGEVWKCEAPGGLFKAIKFVYGDLESTDEEGGERAEQELKALARVKTVRHPYILSLERYDIIGGRLLVVMELADRNMWDRFKECRAQGLPGIPREELLRYMKETAEALDMMNQEHGLQHLDIKPQNIFLVHQHVKVADFGLVKDLEGMKASVTGGVTPVYAAPETFDGWVSRYCDQYSLAICYQELLTGQRPFTGTNVRQLILQHLQAEPNVAALPEGDRPVILRSLSKKPEDRFPTCEEMVALLEAAGAAEAASPSAAAPGSLAPAGSPEAGAEGLASALTGVDSGEHTTGGSTKIIRGSSAAVRRPGLPAEASPPGEAATFPEAAPLEIPRFQGETHTGPGVLFPALVIGLGQTGMNVLRDLRGRVTDRFVSHERLPNLRTLLVDTDAEVVRGATRGETSTALAASEVLLAPLHRPAHYLRRRDGQVPVETWLPQSMLYRIPRSQVTAGVRALGRLAFVSSYQGICRRLVRELAACLQPEALAEAAELTGLGMRSSRPRVYIVASLAGGTGSGIFLDLAYTVRALLRKAGYDQPDVIGLLLLPRIDSSRTRVMPLGNTFAALSELSYFASPKACFRARYLENEQPVEDAEPPFNRCLVLPMPDEADEKATRVMYRQAGRALFQDLCSPLGKACDLARAGLAAGPWQERGLHCSTFRMAQLRWPRRELLRMAATQLCTLVVGRWINKDSKPVRELVQGWVQEQWRAQELTPDSFLSRLQERVAEAEQEDPERILFDIIKPLIQRYSPRRPAPAHAGAGSRRGRPDPAPEEHPAHHQGDGAPVGIPPAETAEVVAQLEALLGKVDPEGLDECQGTLERQIDELAKVLTEEWSQKLAGLAVHMIEDPLFRLAGAEEALRQLSATLEQVLQHYEPLTQELETEARQAHAYLMRIIGAEGGEGEAAAQTPTNGMLRSLLGSLRGGPAGKEPAGRKDRLVLSAADTIQLLRGYSQTRYKSLLLQKVGQAFLCLRGHVVDELREVGHCRARLSELRQRFSRAAPEAIPGGKAEDETASERLLLPAGASSLVQLVGQLMMALTEQHVLDLDQHMEAMLRDKFVALVNVCLGKDDVLTQVELAMLQTAEEYAGTFLRDADTAEIFFERHSSEESQLEEIGKCYDEAEPRLPGPASRPGPRQNAQLCVLAVPPGPAGVHLDQQARKVLPDVDVQTAESDGDILFYRELAYFPLAGLEQCGPTAREAYRQMSGTEKFTPHTRTDIRFDPIG